MAAAHGAGTSIASPTPAPKSPKAEDLLYKGLVRYSFFFMRACEDERVRKYASGKPFSNLFLKVLLTTRDMLSHWTPAITCVNMAELGDNYVVALRMLGRDITKRVTFRDTSGHPIRPTSCFIQEGYVKYAKGVELISVSVSDVEAAFDSLSDEVKAALREAADLLPMDL